MPKRRRGGRKYQIRKILAQILDISLDQLKTSSVKHLLHTPLNLKTLPFKFEDLQKTEITLEFAI